MIVDTAKWNDEPITIGNLLEMAVVFDIFSLFLWIAGIAFLCCCIIIFFGIIVLGLVKKMKNNYKFPNISNIKNIRIG